MRRLPLLQLLVPALMLISLSACSTEKRAEVKAVIADVRSAAKQCLADPACRQLLVDAAKKAASEP